MKARVHVTLKTGVELDMSIDMPSLADDDLWADRVSNPETGGQVAALAIKSWIIAAQTIVRRATDEEEAYKLLHAWKFGDRAAPVARVVTVDADMEWTELQIAELEAQGILLK